MQTVKLVYLNLDKWGDDDRFVGVADNLTNAKKLAQNDMIENHGEDFGILRWDSKPSKYATGRRYWQSKNGPYLGYHISTSKVFTG